MELRCPTCGALLYSRRSRLCGQCGAVLPQEMVLTDEEAKAISEEREWARERADAFDSTGRLPKAGQERGDSVSARARYEAAMSSPEDLIRRVSCAGEFRYRKRPTWLYVSGCAVCLAVMAASFFILHRALRGLDREAVSAWFILSGFTAVSWYVAWRRAAPFCPNCKQDIRTCLMEYCHVCGEPLRHKRCSDCGVDNSWTGWFRPHGNGMFRWIKYCPGCSVELDSMVRRWKAGD